MNYPDPMLKNMPPGSRPAEIEAAESLIGATLIDPACLDEVALRVGVEDFYRPMDRVVWGAILALHKAGSPIDVVMLHQELNAQGALELAGGRARLAELTEKVPTSASAGYYADTVLRGAHLRQLIRAAAEAMRFAYEATPAMRADDVQAHVERLVRAEAPDRVVSGAPIGDLAAEVVARARRGEVPVSWSTGFRDLDEQLAGGVRPSLLTLIAARPSMGKTAMATRIARNVAWQQIGVSFFSLEVPRAQLVANMIGAEVRLAPRIVGLGALSEAEWSRVEVAALDHFQKLPMRVHDGKWTMRALAAAIRHDVRRHGTKVALIDYLQLVTPDEKGRSRAEEVGEISRELKLLAVDLGVSIVALAQLSREIEKRKDKWPNMSDLRESGNLEQDADNILLLHRPEYYEPAKEDLRGLAHVDVAKQRDGPRGVVDLSWSGESMRFDDMPKREPESAWQRQAREARERAAVGAAESEDA